MPPKKLLTVNEALRLLEEDDSFHSADVFILPPNNDVLTDKDSDDDDQPSNINHLSGNQLCADAELVLKENGRKKRLVQPSSKCSVLKASEPTSLPQKKNVERKWVKKHITSSPLPSLPKPTFLQHEWTPVELFELFFDEEVVSLIIDMSKEYAKQKGDHTFTVSIEEIKVFIAILLVSGYTHLPRRRMYWEEAPDVQNKAVCEAMSRNRFEEILQYLHIADNNNLPENDKFGKVRPLWSMLNERWLKYFTLTNSLSVDESMIPYYGHHGTKQHIHGKPIRFGYKVWCLCTPLGYLIQGEPYQGAKTGNTCPELGVGGSVVIDLISELRDDFSATLYFDNFFTSLKLLDALRDKGFLGTGTVRTNRIDNAPLKNPKVIEKEVRGSFDFIQDTSSGCILVRWNDNKVVTVASTAHGVHPITKVRRWSKKEKKYLEVEQPEVIHKYNQFMGGVDRLDQNVGLYRIAIRSKKWWWPLFSFPINVCVQNAWQLYRETKGYVSEKLDLLAFTRRIVLCYLQRYSARTGIGRPKSRGPARKRVMDEIRFDHLDHIVAISETQIRCAHCSGKTKTKCTKCKIGLDVKCFKDFHKV